MSDEEIEYEDVTEILDGNEDEDRDGDIGGVEETKGQPEDDIESLNEDDESIFSNSKLISKDLEEYINDESSDSEIDDNEKSKNNNKVISESLPLSDEESDGEFNKNMEESDEEESEEDESDDESNNITDKINLETKLSYIKEFHVQEINSSSDEIAVAANVTRDSNNIINDIRHRTIPILTKYEKSRILGIRISQLNDGAHPFVKLKDGDTTIDKHLIAEKELREKSLPFIITRPLPNGKKEYWRLQDLEVI